MSESRGSHWWYGHCFLPINLFDNYDAAHKLKVRKDHCIEVLGSANKKFFCAKVFIYFFKLMLLDIIEKNTTFVFPTPGRHVYMGVKAYHDEDAAKGVQRGWFRGIDMFNSDFTGYMVSIMTEGKKARVDQPVSLSTNLYNRFVELINSGKKYY